MLKRKLAALLAGAMVLTSLPMVSFARSDNNISYVPTVKKDDTTFNIDNAPVLTIVEKDNTFGDGLEQTFRLTFEGAEWKGDDYGTYHPDGAATNVTKITYSKLTKNIVEIKFTGTSADDDTLEIPMLAKVTADGESKVTINPLNSKVSPATYIFANGGSGTTKTTVADKTNFPDELDVADIIIDEVKAQSMPHRNEDGDIAEDKKIKLTAPRGFEWSWDGKDANLVGTGAYTNDVDYKSYSFPRYGRYNSTDKEVIEIFYDNESAYGETELGGIIIKNLKLVATEDADYGDVKVEISGDDITTESILVGTYVEYGVIVEAEDAERELFSGRYYGNDEDDAYKLLKLTIKEGVADSWWSERNTTITLPDWVKVREVKVDDVDKITSGITKGDYMKNEKANDTKERNPNIFVNKDKNMITIKNIETEDEEKGKVVLLIWVSMDADQGGDITAVVGGPGMPEDQEVVLGKALVVAEAEFDTTEAQIGYKQIPVADIEITESKAGALERGKQLIIAPESYSEMSFDDHFDFDVEVTSGDLQIGDVELEGGRLVIDIKRDSKEASTIKISNAGVYLNRSVAEGSYDLLVYGDAFLQNYKRGLNVTTTDTQTITIGDEEYTISNYGVNPNYDPEEGFTTDALRFADFIKIVTPAPNKGEASGAAVTASFTVGSADYTVGDEVATADAAPYIKDGRTMIPVKYAAFALGVEPSNIKWDQATKTATILGDRVIQVKIGSKDLVVNGAVLTMDVAAEVVDGRTYLPISWVASALNVPYSWDDATKTVTFN